MKQKKTTLKTRHQSQATRARVPKHHHMGPITTKEILGRIGTGENA